MNFHLSKRVKKKNKVIKNKTRNEEKYFEKEI